MYSQLHNMHSTGSDAVYFFVVETLIIKYWPYSGMNKIFFKFQYGLMKM